MLRPEELAYMRQTQDDAHPTAARLQRRTLGRSPSGGAVEVWADPGEPIMVRVDGQPDEIPLNLASRLEGGTAVSIALGMATDVRSGDRLWVTADEVYELVSDGTPDPWATAQNVIARRLVHPSRA